MVPPPADEDAPNDAARTTSAAPTGDAKSSGVGGANPKPDAAVADVESSSPASSSRRVPSGRAAEIAAQGEFFRWSFADTSQSGIYLVRISGATDTVERFAVNVDPRESDPAKLPSVRLTEQPWSGVKFHYDTELQEFDAPTQKYIAPNDERPIHRLLLMAALAAVVAETLIAGRIAENLKVGPLDKGRR